MLSKLKLRILSFRYGARLSYKFTEVAGMLLQSWKFLRDYPLFVSDVYDRCVKIAQKRQVDIPKPRIEMYVFEVEKNGEKRQVDI